MLLALPCILPCCRCKHRCSSHDADPQSKSRLVRRDAAPRGRLGSTAQTLPKLQASNLLDVLLQELVSHKQSNITIRRQDMESLRGLNWLNDEIMNVYVNLLQVRLLATSSGDVMVRLCCINWTTWRCNHSSQK